MIIPKEFAGLQDLESMLLTSILGTLVSLKEDLISFEQAESYWFSDFTAQLFEEMNLSEEIVDILHQGIELKDLKSFSSIYNQKLDSLILKVKEQIGSNYTEYNETTITISNTLN